MENRNTNNGPFGPRSVLLCARAVAVLILLGSWPLWAGDSVEYVPARSYFEVARRELAGAKSSVTVCLYLFSLRSTASDREVFQLAQSLLTARDRGVRVEVFLDNGGSGQADEGRGFNGPACAFLLAQGISVYQDDASSVAHTKAIVIDAKTVLIGSTNWTDAALNKNLEANVLVHSPNVAQAVLADLRQGAWRAVPGPIDGRGEVPTSFFQDPQLFGAMVGGRDERALDMSLWLFKQSTGSFTVNMDDVAVVLGMDDWTREASRRQIIKTLNKLQNRFGLIRVDYSFSKDPRITWTYSFKKPTGKEAGGTPALPQAHRFAETPSGGVHVPEAYWALGWNRRLSLAGKCFFWINQIESAAAVTRPRWNVARTALADRYHLSAGLVTRGVTELRRQNLVEVEYGPLTKNGPRDRPPNIYTPNPLYDPVLNDARRAHLIERAGSAAVARAQSAAHLIYEDNDMTILEELVDLESRFGRPRMDHALAVLSRMNVDNPKRNFPYFKGIVQSE